MSVPNTNFQNTYTTDGVTATWAFTFVIVDLASVKVYLNGVLQGAGTYQVVADLVNPGGVVTFLAGSIPLTGQALLLQRQSDTLQANTFATNASLPPTTLVGMFDKLTIIAQQLSAQIVNSLAVPLQAVGVSAAVPYPIVPGAFMVWNAAANALQYVSPIQAGLALLDQGPGLPPAYGAVTSATGGNVAGALSSIDGDLAGFSGTSGKILQDLGIKATDLTDVFNGYRLSVSSLDPDPADFAGNSVVNSVPYKHDKISLWTGSKWAIRTPGLSALPVPANQYFREYDWYTFDNAGVAADELLAWDSGGQTTASITAATLANPCVLTTAVAHGLNVGDRIGIRGGTSTGTGWTDPVQGLDQKEYYVSAVTSTTVTLEGSSTNVLAFTTYSNAFLYRVPAAPVTGQVRLNGVLVKASDSTRRFRGTFKTNGNGTVDDTVTARMLSNVDNQVDAIIEILDATNYTTVATGTMYARTNSLANRLRFVTALTQVVRIVFEDYPLCAAGSVSGIGIGMDRVAATNPRSDYQTIMSPAGITNASHTLAIDFKAAPGSHWAQMMNYGGGNGHQGAYCVLHGIVKR